MIIGDAAHAMVPFYGQGMNAGLEDVRVLFDHIRLHPESLSDALASYSAHRRPDGHCINDLAMRNYVEMRSSVTSKAYLLRKFIEESLYAYVPWLGVRTMYSMVSFSNIRYSEVVKKARRQKVWLDMTTAVLGLGVVATVLGTERRTGFMKHVGEVVRNALQQGR